MIRVRSRLNFRAHFHYAAAGGTLYDPLLRAGNVSAFPEKHALKQAIANAVEARARGPPTPNSEGEEEENPGASGGGCVSPKQFHNSFFVIVRDPQWRRAAAIALPFRRTLRRFGRRRLERDNTRRDGLSFTYEE